MQVFITEQVKSRPARSNWFNNQRLAAGQIKNSSLLQYRPDVTTNERSSQGRRKITGRGGCWRIEGGLLAHSSSPFSGSSASIPLSLLDEQGCRRLMKRRQAVETAPRGVPPPHPPAWVPLPGQSGVCLYRRPPCRPALRANRRFALRGHVRAGEPFTARDGGGTSERCAYGAGSPRRRTRWRSP